MGGCFRASSFKVVGKRGGPGWLEDSLAHAGTPGLTKRPFSLSVFQETMRRVLSGRWCLLSLGAGGSRKVMLVMLPLKASKGTGVNVCFWLCGPGTVIIPISQMRMTRLGEVKWQVAEQDLDLDLVNSSPAVCNWVQGRKGGMGMVVATWREVV